MAALAQPGWTWDSATEAGVAGFTAGQRSGRSDAGKGVVVAVKRIQARRDRIRAARQRRGLGEACTPAACVPAEPARISGHQPKVLPNGRMCISGSTSVLRPSAAHRNGSPYLAAPNPSRAFRSVLEFTVLDPAELLRRPATGDSFSAPYQCPSACISGFTSVLRESLGASGSTRKRCAHIGAVAFPAGDQPAPRPEAQPIRRSR